MDAEKIFRETGKRIGHIGEWESNNNKNNCVSMYVSCTFECMYVCMYVLVGGYICVYVECQNSNIYIWIYL